MVKKLDNLMIKGMLKKQQFLDSIKEKSKDGVLTSMEITILIIVVIAVVLVLKGVITKNMNKVNTKVDGTIDTILQ